MFSRKPYNGIKQTFTGVVGLKMWPATPITAEHEAVVLNTDDGAALKIFVQEQNPFRNPALDPFLGQRVSIQACKSEINGPSQYSDRLFVSSLNDIVGLAPAKP